MEKIGTIEIQTLLGASHWAQTYQGRDTETNRPTVVKIFTPAALGDPTIRARYQREIQLVNTLSHPSIVPISRFGEENERMYIVMPLLPGGSLEDRLRRGPVPPDEAALMIQRLAAALDAVHALNITHGDLKPSNILFDYHGFPMVSDFGMIKFAESIAANFPGAVIGPPVTLSPERLMHRTLEPTSDVYALGQIFYQMLGGLIPYAHGSALQAILAKQDRSLDPLSGSIGIFNEILFKATDRNPEKRYPSTGAFSEAITEVVASGAGTAQETITGFPKFDNPPPPPSLEKRSWFGKTQNGTDEKMGGKERTRKPMSSFWIYTRFILLIVLLITLSLATGIYLRSLGYQQAAIIPQEAVRVIREFAFPEPAHTRVPTLTPIQDSTQTPEEPTPTLHATNQIDPSPTPQPTQISITPAFERPLTPKAFGEGGDYQPVRGENLFNIAGSYHADLSDMLNANGIKGCSFTITNRAPVFIPQPVISRRSNRPASLSTGNGADFNLIETLDCMSGINQIKLSPDGNLLAVAAGTNIYIWDAQDWTPIRVLTGHMLEVTAIDFSPNSKILVSGSLDTMVKIWDPIGGEIIQTLYDHKSRITAVSFSSSGDRMATLSAEQGLILYLYNGFAKFSKSIEKNFSGGLAAVYAPASERIIVGFKNRIQIYETSTLEIREAASMEAQDAVEWIVVSPDGRLAASGTEVWHLDELEHLFTLDQSAGRVVFAPDSQTFFGGGRFWKTSNGRTAGDLNTTSIPDFPIGNRALHSAAITPDGMYLIWANQSRVSIWALPDSYAAAANPTVQTYVATQQDTRSSIANQFGVSLQSLLTTNGMDCTNPIFEGQVLVIPTDSSAFQQQVEFNLPTIDPAAAHNLSPLYQMEMTCANVSGDLIFSADNRLLTSGSAVWDVAHASILVQTQMQTVRAEGSPLKLSKDPSLLIAVSPDQKEAAIRTGKDIEIWDLESGHLDRVLSEHQGPISSIVYSPDGQMLATGGAQDEQSIRVWRINDDQLFSYIPRYAIQRLNFSLDNKRFFGETLDTFRVWNVGEIEPVLSIPRLDRRAVLSPDREMLGYTSGGLVVVHDLVKNEVVQNRLAGHLAGYQMFEFSPDSKLLAAANDYGIAVWDIGSGVLTHWLSDEADKTKITMIAYSPDGKMIASIANQTLRIWDVEAEQIIFHTASPSAIHKIAFSPGGQFLAVLTDYDITLWGISP